MIGQNPYPARTEGLEADNTVYAKPALLGAGRVSLRKRGRSAM
jgi:hypothetical protein